MESYHGANFYLILSILARVLAMEYFPLVFNMTCCCVSTFLPVNDLEKRKEPKPRVKVVDKGNGHKPSPPEEGQFFVLFWGGDFLILGVELF